MTRNSAIALILSLPLLAACGTQQERCISRNTSEYRTVSRLLADVEGNLARGYAWEERQVVRERLTQCHRYSRDRHGRVHQTVRPCWRDYVDTQRYRVPIDPAVETRKRDNLRQHQEALAGHAKSAVEACRAAYPEDDKGHRITTQAPS